MHNKIRLISGKVPTTNSSNVTSDRYNFLDISSAEPNLGVAPANNYILVYNTNTQGNRQWANISTLLSSNIESNIIPSNSNTYTLGSSNNSFLAVYANNYYGTIDGGTFV